MRISHDSNVITYVLKSVIILIINKNLHQTLYLAIFLQLLHFHLILPPDQGGIIHETLSK